MKPCEICAILPDVLPAYVIYEGEYWVANLRERDQTLLGTSFITAKRHVPELNELTKEEDDEFRLIRNALIGSMRKAFNPITINTSCLKNDAFQDDPDNTPSDAAHVHWHLKPRYGTRTINFAGEDFQDPAPGRYLSQYPRHAVNAEIAVAISDTLRLNFEL